ncbi:MULTISPECIES: thiosulfate sulfurtransferase GlpE [Thalassolituus]|jgi:thiosulfate sulfurtransferase|uniref:Thiosulfate sulfurtransferase GlpE n=1 Tax=Thalassolituus oleivorans MIL-1 TaxID=1298593 RepID=M5DNM8_9GAMM|nr:thiosulfate sulfurtransferase GlpE [Thalassolituus oleivorans]PCI49708.1 MAG: thiosulfate sulfurtransferase GlpE [Oceanospirillales bacterium]PHQ88194.1 MAG: thiosulfate sulfurtransferase GlpE [Thalassobium sp.]AHK16679.1 thiosulfate sulfurtransferase [Thalassolituus oleivorans R6-15]MBQ0726278.1 thiosulfate sulfurtransferase GlpE [Thalassolituus oleivorans]MBQ0781303.1 thiosulfate sulfurtransferase GlpE [Thalassolituus oleivorans]|tara:strand:+ start:725 stop:1045 length:321 start_codon:yes stop_codon:yes gene_type:complete
MSGFKRISPADAKVILEQGNAKVADIRDVMSFQAGHIRDAIRVDNDNLPEFMAAASKELPLLVCCYHGNSSQGAAQFFSEQGFSDVYSIDGGYEMWKMVAPDWCNR